ncbi:E3 SUMO-protein ligase ZBED1-like [Epargyreus clarus]|uniref:E3 SUMO-protein ligase ZBED1-like n=1 Tax=Epargyreus clarus TaxID=520877 RepID=UPI003C2C1984
MSEVEKFTMAPPKKSHVWKFFTKIEGNEKLVKCKICQKTLKSCGNTSNLLCHAKNIHKAAYLEINKENSQVLSNVDLLNIHTESDTKTNKADTEPAVPSADPMPSTSTAASKYIHVDNPVSRPLKRQKSIHESFENISAYSESGNKTLKVNNALIYMICKDNQPFTIVENDGFRNLMKVTAPHYKLPSKTTLTRWVDDKYEALSAMFKNKLKSVENITLTTDMWTETMSMRSFLGITGHFGICTDFFSITLGVYQSFDRNTSDHIAEMLLNSCAEWNIALDKVSAVVTDNAASMIKAVNLSFGKKHIPCFAHTLNLVALNAIQHCPELQHLISKVKNIVTWFKQSNTASNELRNATEKETKLIQEVATRWNSTYYMIERFLELRTVINDIIFRHKTAPSMLNASELSVLSSVLLVLPTTQ